MRAITAELDLPGPNKEMTGILLASVTICGNIGSNLPRASDGWIKSGLVHVTIERPFGSQAVGCLGRDDMILLAAGAAHHVPDALPLLIGYTLKLQHAIQQTRKAALP